MKKRFDCVRMKSQAQRKIRAAVAGMTRNEEVAYFRAGAKGFASLLSRAKATANARSPR